MARRFISNFCFQVRVGWALSNAPTWRARSPTGPRSCSAGRPPAPRPMSTRSESPCGRCSAARRPTPGRIRTWLYSAWWRTDWDHRWRSKGRWTRAWWTPGREDGDVVERCYRDLMRECWEADARDRPSAQDLADVLYLWNAYFWTCTVSVHGFDFEMHCGYEEATATGQRSCP